MTPARAAILAMAGLTLAACGNVHPGAAAVVDDQTISMKTLNRTAGAYCTLTLEAAKQQGVGSVSNLDIRRQAVTGLVSLVVARDIAKSEHLEIEPRAYQLTESQHAQIAKAFPKADTATISQAIEDSQQVSAIAIALAEKATGQKRTAANEAQLAEAGQAVIAKAFKSHDVTFAPRFGLGPSGKEKSVTGSLAASPTDLEAPAAEELPDSQRCS